MQEDYHRVAMLSMAHEGEEVWTCLHHLNYEKSDIRFQCHKGAKELVKAKRHVHVIDYVPCHDILTL